MLPRLVVISCLGFAGAARAEPRTPPRVSLTIEPLYLVAIMLDTTIEVRPLPHVGIAAIAGYGKPIFAASLWNLGGQANAYLMREFSGLHVGAELQYFGGSVGIPFITEQMDTGRVRVWGAYAGYKCVTHFGLTSILQVGVGHIDATGADPMSRVIPIANFTMGWSF